MSWQYFGAVFGSFLGAFGVPWVFVGGHLGPIGQHQCPWESLGSLWDAFGVSPECFWDAWVVPLGPSGMVLGDLFPGGARWRPREALPETS